MGLHLQVLASKSPQVRGCRGKLLWSRLSMPSRVGLDLAELHHQAGSSKQGMTHSEGHRLKQSLRPSLG